MSRDANWLLWLDLETNGAATPQEGAVLEVAVIAMPLLPPTPGHPEDDLIVVADLPSLSLLVDDPARGEEPSCEFYAPPKVVREMHETSGLWYDLDEQGGMTPQEADVALSAFIAQGVERWGGKPGLAGSGVAHYDSKWMEVWLPDSRAAMHYWTLDVGVLRRALRFAGVTARLVGYEVKTHRALDDARLHAEEWLQYRSLLAQLG